VSPETASRDDREQDGLVIRMIAAGGMKNPHTKRKMLMRNIPNLLLVLEGLTTPRLAGAADDGCVPDYRHILAKSHAVPASFAQNDVKNTAQRREGGATI